MAFSPSCKAALTNSSDSMGKSRRWMKVLALDDDRVQQQTERRAAAFLDVSHAVVVLGEVLLELRDRVSLLALAHPHELFAGQDEVDTAGVFGQAGQLVGGEPRRLLVPAVKQAIPLVDLEVGRLGTATDQGVIDVLGHRVDILVVGEGIAE